MGWYQKMGCSSWRFEKGGGSNGCMDQGGAYRAMGSL